MFARLLRRRHKMTCRLAVELMTDYLEGALAEPERARFEAHLAGCDACTAYLEQLRAAIATLGAIEADTVPADVLDGLVDVYRRYRSA